MDLKLINYIYINLFFGETNITNIFFNILFFLITFHELNIVDITFNGIRVIIIYIFFNKIW